MRGAVDAAGSAADRGDLDLACPLPLAPRNGDAVLLMPGVPVREGGLLGLLMEGLSHDEKKSSGSPAGVFAPLPSLMSATSSTVTLSGFLCACQPLFLYAVCHTTHFLWSASTRRASSSLYLFAVLLVYFVLGSLLASAADPPCD